MRLTFVISSLAGGGAERVLVNLTRGFLERGHDVSVVTMFGAESNRYALPEGAKQIALDIAGYSPHVLSALWNNIRRLIGIRRVVGATQPDVVISFMDRTNVLALLALQGTHLPVLVTEHVDPRMISCGKIWERLRFWLYPRASCVVSVSQGLDQYFSWVKKEKRAVIYNPLFINGAKEKDEYVWNNALKKHIIAMGRLTYQKGFDLLINAFAQVAEKHPDWELHILGEGEERPALVSLVAKFKLDRRVFLPGWISDPFPILRASDFFVMSSRFEGFGNVLCEAMACGLPVISFDCPTGPSEIIRHGEDGLLIPSDDVDALASAMDHLMFDEEERKRLAARAPEVIERFSLQKVMGMWEEVVSSAMRTEL